MNIVIKVKETMNFHSKSNSIVEIMVSKSHYNYGPRVFDDWQWSRHSCCCNKVATSKLAIKLCIYGMYKNEIAPAILFTISKRSTSSTLLILLHWQKSDLRISYQEVVLVKWCHLWLWGEGNVRSWVSKTLKKRLLDAGVNEIKMKWHTLFTLCSSAHYERASERRAHHSSHTNWENTQ